MPTDLNGTPTPLGIGTYDVDLDAPSGLGFNAAMLQIDALISARVAKPAGIAVGETPVWNGTGWDRSSVTKVNASNVAPGSNGQYLQTVAGVSTWAAGPGAWSFGTSLPGSPSDGDIAVLVDSTSAPTYQWVFRYVAAKSTNKWVFIGGTPILAEVATNETTTSTTYTNLATIGPSLTIPVWGDYVVEQGLAGTGGATGGVETFMSYEIGNTSLGTATITIASPAVVTKATHGLVAGDMVSFTTTGALPTGLAINTPYYVLSSGLTANDFQLSLTPGGAAINTSGTQSGTHTLIKGISAQDVDAAIQFFVPNSSPTLYRKHKKTGLPAYTLTAKYRLSSGASGTIPLERRWLSVLPIAVGG